MRAMSKLRGCRRKQPELRMLRFSASSVAYEVEIISAEFALQFPCGCGTCSQGLSIVCGRPRHLTDFRSLWLNNDLTRAWRYPDPLSDSRLNAEGVAAERNPLRTRIAGLPVLRRATSRRKICRGNFKIKHVHRHFTRVFGKSEAALPQEPVLR